MDTNIKSIMNKIGDFYAEGGVTDMEIKKAEAELGLKFASDYNEYLSAYGCVSFGSHELTGLTKVERLNVVEVTKENRQFNKNIPADFYVIEETDIDGIVIWENSKGRIYATVFEREPEEIFKSLGEYINTRLIKNINI